MNKKQRVLIGIALVLLFAGIWLATSNSLSASSDVEIYAFDQNLAGSDKGNEGGTLYNPSNESVDIGNRILDKAKRIKNGEIGVTNRMDIIEVLLTVCLTVVGAMAIAFTNFYLEGRKRRRILFRALYDEIKLNQSITQKLLKNRRSETVFELAPLYTLSYQNIRITGELLILPEKLRMELEEVYELISAHHRQLPAVYEPIPRDRGFYERLENISKKLEHLENEFPKILKFLR